MNIQVIPFDSNHPNPFFHSPDSFRALTASYYIRLKEFYPGDFAQLPALSSGDLGQGASL